MLGFVYPAIAETVAESTASTPTSTPCTGLMNVIEDERRQQVIDEAKPGQHIIIQGLGAFP
jgi:hypothetical protein